MLKRSQMQWVLEKDEEVAGLIITGISRRMIEAKALTRAGGEGGDEQRGSERKDGGAGR